MKLVEIKYCGQCPDYIVKTMYEECAKAQRCFLNNELWNKEEDRHEPFPEWCPLEDTK